MAKKIKLKKYQKSKNPIIDTRRLAIANSPDIMAIAIRKALAGDNVMIKFFLEKIVGKDNLDIGIKTPNKGTTTDKVNGLWEQMGVSGTTASDFNGQQELIELMLHAKETEDLEKMLEDMENDE